MRGLLRRGSPVAAMPKMLGLVGELNLTSFLDVRFGDSLYRVQTKFPSGAIETASRIEMRYLRAISTTLGTQASCLISRFCSRRSESASGGA